MFYARWQGSGMDFVHFFGPAIYATLGEIAIPE
jgi:hypothetical protein